MQVITYLRQHGLQSLQDTFHVRTTRHGKYNNLVLLKYDQIDSPIGEKVVQECRGLILDEQNDWKVIARPYDRFFNYGEGHAAKIDWQTAKVYEKLDGSILSAYHYDGEWQVATSGTPDASGTAHDSGITFRELFWETWSKLNYDLPTLLTVTHMFELMTPQNRVIVPHATPRIVLHGARDLYNMQELSPSFFKNNNWEKVKAYPLTSIEQVEAAAMSLNPMQSEGFIVVDDAFSRIKIKSPAYVALSHMKDGFSERRMLELVRTNEGYEFLAFFPEYKPLYDKISDSYNDLVSYLECEYERLKGIEVQKDFALQATRTRLPGALFSLRAGHAATVRAYLADVSINSLERHI